MVKCRRRTGAAADRRTLRCTPTFAARLRFSSPSPYPWDRSLRPSRSPCPRPTMRPARRVTTPPSAPPSRRSPCAPCKSGIANVDYRATVGDAWRRSALDEIVDKRVDLAVDEVRQRDQLGHPAAIARQPAEGAGAGRPPSPSASTAPTPSRRRSRSLPSASAGGRRARSSSRAEDAAEPALACLKAFVGARYGVSRRAARSTAGQDDVALDPSKGGGRDLLRRGAAANRAAASPAPRC